MIIYMKVKKPEETESFHKYFLGALLTERESEDVEIAIRESFS